MGRVWGIVACVFAVVCAAQEATQLEAGFVLEQRATLRGTTPIRFDIWSKPSRNFEDRLLVYGGDTLVYTNEDDAHQGGYELCLPNDLVSGATQDIDGDGHGEVVARFFTGGAHCCFGYLFFSVADGVSLLAEIEPGDYDLKLTDLDHDSVAECEIRDGTFDYWNASHADSTLVPVTVRYKDAKFILAGNLMKAHSLVAENMGPNAFRNAMAQSEHEGFQPRDIPWAPLAPRTWGLLLYYIYSGRAADGWRLFEEAWPEGKRGLDLFKADFEAQLRKSPYYEEIMAMQDEDAR